MKVAVWGPLPPTRSRVAEHTAEMLPVLATHHEVVAVVEEPGSVDTGAIPGITVGAGGSVPEVDLDVYQIGTGPAEVFVYRAALARPGVAVLHRWILHDLVWREAEERGDVSRYLRAMRHSHGAEGAFVGRQVASGRGGTMWPRLHSVNDRLLERSLGVVTPTRDAGRRLRLRHPHLPNLHLPPHLADPVDRPSARAEARRASGLPGDALLVTAAVPATSPAELDALIRAVGRLRGELSSLCLVLAGEIDPSWPWRAWAAEAGLADALVATGPLSAEALQDHLVAADVVSMLRFPAIGELPGDLVRALGVGRPVLVTAGTPAAEEMPEDVVIPVDPGPRQGVELVGLLRRLLASGPLREAVGGRAREHALAHYGLEASAARLAAFLVEVQEQRPRLRSQIGGGRTADGSLTGEFVDEVRRAARDLGLGGPELGLDSLLAPLGERPEASVTR